MFLDIIVIVLRETLEASILIGILLSISRNMNLKSTWVPVSLLVGSIGGVTYGYTMGIVSGWFDYSGQEVVNAALQLMLYCLIVILISIQWLKIGPNSKVLQMLLCTIALVALIREGAELYVFYSGFLQKENVLIKASTSGFVGLSVGLSVGAIVFYSLAFVNQTKVKFYYSSALMLVAAGMMLQAAQLLIQVDWISSGEPLWDSSVLVEESSVVGQVAYAVFGYEATPSLIEFGVYVGAIAFLIVSVLAVAKVVSLRFKVQQS